MPKVFGIEHFIYLIVVTSLIVAALIFVKKRAKDEKFLRKAVLISGLIFLALITTNRISLVFRNDSFKSIIPNTFCGFASFFFALVLIFGKKDNAALQFIAMVTIVSGTIASIYPDFIGQHKSVFYIPTISGMLHHSMQVYCSLLVLITGYLKPTMKRWATVPIGLAFFMTYGVFLVDALGIDGSMQIDTPFVAGTFLTWYFVLAMDIILYTIALIIIDIKTMPKEQQFLFKLKRRLLKNNEDDIPQP